MGERCYQAQEFAELSEVTVRTLHHYDRIGLLKPSGRTKAGYRLYDESDLARLQQILTLKFVGFSLIQIKDLLEGRRLDLASTLRFQRAVIEEQRRRLDAALAAIDQAEHVARTGSGPDWNAIKKIIEVIQMQNNTEWVKKYYTDEQLRDLAKRGTPEVLAKAQADWAALIQDVEASLGEDPAGDKAQELARRWEDLIEQFTGGDPGIRANLKKLYADQANHPSTFKKPYSDQAGEFIQRAIAARRK